jgi:hypothetical protein
MKLRLRMQTVSRVCGHVEGVHHVPEQEAVGGWAAKSRVEMADLGGEGEGAAVLAAALLFFPAAGARQYR